MVTNTVTSMVTSMVPFVGERTGRVVVFDEARGLGEVRDVEGAGGTEVDHPFHCIEITDGTRSIEVGAAVRFEVRPKLGRLEAVGVRPV